MLEFVNELPDKKIKLISIDNLKASQKGSTFNALIGRINSKEATINTQNENNELCTLILKDNKENVEVTLSSNSKILYKLDYIDNARFSAMYCQNDTSLIITQKLTSLTRKHLKYILRNGHIIYTTNNSNLDFVFMDEEGIKGTYTEKYTDGSEIKINFSFIHGITQGVNSLYIKTVEGKKYIANFIINRLDISPKISCIDYFYKAKNITYKRLTNEDEIFEVDSYIESYKNSLLHLAFEPTKIYEKIVHFIANPNNLPFYVLKG